MKPDTPKEGKLPGEAVASETLIEDLESCPMSGCQACSPCKDHLWVTKRVGGAPDDEFSGELVTYCTECGEEKKE